MASFKSKMFNFLLRNRHLMQGRLTQEVYTDDSSITTFREQCEKGAARYAKVPEGVEIKPQMIEGIPAERLIPRDADPKKVIMYVHGGGYVAGSCNDHRGFISKFAKNTGVINLVYEYRLAPEHPYPAALDDSVRIYKWLLQSGFEPENILIAGESAGGGLTLAILLALKDRNIPMPVAAVAISPWADLTCSSESYKTKNKVSLAPLNSWLVFSKHYVGSHKANDPFISPMYGDLKGLPPMLINAGTDDELFEDGEKFSLKAQKAGVEVTFRKGEGQVHCYPLLAPLFPEATEAMNEIVAFIKQHLNIH
ncbi:MAG TPA: alpha/beta hydrolase [Prolixibacteraceae bacterium]|nr:alpha/beta hydrolase [Prolixibacteraceae bacterium]